MWNSPCRAGNSTECKRWKLNTKYRINYAAWRNKSSTFDKTLLLQEFLTAKDSSIIRVETIGGKYIYAIKINLTEGEFNLCPADYCKIDDQNIDGMKDGVSDRGSVVEKFDPPQDIIQNVEKIFQSAKIDVGGLEYLVNSEDGETYIYDINAMSNFVADPYVVLGFDPNDNLVDYIGKKLEL